ncbi:hypothetical protein LCGC14_1071210 [marine sediment metagenome]|uniref:Uncharacterized protein n=1 Tax=marine sediment metagenome TaxID=412755 RepID=A0A0F9N5E2_9ZZZZ
MAENTTTEENECSSSPETDKEEMIRSGRELLNVCCANRDGDLHYIECPECSCVDLKPKRIMMCKDCGQHFSLYFEDGFKSFDVKKFWHTFDKEKQVKIIHLQSNDMEWHVPYPRHDIDSMEPAEIKILYKDLKNGKDGHGHQRYRKFALIPLD